MPAWAWEGDVGARGARFSVPGHGNRGLLAVRYAGDAAGKGGIYNFVTKRGLCAGPASKISWTQVRACHAMIMASAGHAAITRRFMEACSRKLVRE